MSLTFSTAIIADGSGGGSSWSAFFVNKDVGSDNWLRLAEDLEDSNLHPFITPFQGTLNRLTFGCESFGVANYVIQIFINNVLVLTQPIVSTVLRQSFNISLPINQEDLLSIRMVRVSGGGGIREPVIQLYS